MSPYRVLVEIGNNSDTKVLSSMLSIDKLTGEKMIYIVDKLINDVKDDEYISPKLIAHTQSGKRNSDIVCTYKLVKEGYHTYSVMRAYFSSESHQAVWMNTSIKEFTQSDCLKSAMLHYCSSVRYKILQDL